VLSLADSEAEPEEIEPAHLPDVLESLAQAKRREFATDAEVEAAFRRFDPAAVRPTCSTRPSLRPWCDTKGSG